MENFENRSDTEIMKRLQAGDEEAFTQLYHQYWGKLYVAALARLKDEYGAEEVVQKVFVRLWNKKSDLDIQNLSAYLSAMTRYAVYEHLAREYKLKERERKWTENVPETFSVGTQIENKFLLHFIQELSNELPFYARYSSGRPHRSGIDLPVCCTRTPSCTFPAIRWKVPG